MFEDLFGGRNHQLDAQSQSPLRDQHVHTDAVRRASAPHRLVHSQSKHSREREVHRAELSEAVGARDARHLLAQLARVHLDHVRARLVLQERRLSIRAQERLLSTHSSR